MSTRGLQHVALGALLAILVTVLPGCGTGPPDHVRLGVVAPLSGSRAYIGQEVEAGVRMAVEDINEAGGLLGRPVEVVVADDADLVDLPGQLADLAEQARVSVVIGPESPGVLLGPRSPLTRRSVPVLLPTAFGGDLEDAPTYVARTVPSATAQANALGRWLSEVRGVDEVAVLLADPIEGEAVVEPLRTGFARHGVETVALVRADAAGTAELGPAVDELRRRAGEVGAVLLWGPPPVAARATRAVRDRGWDVQVLVPVSAVVSEYRSLAEEASEGVVLPMPFREEWLGGRMTRWMIRYHLDHGIGALPQLETLVLDLPVVAAASYDAAHLAAAAVERAGSRVPAEVAEALPEVRLDGLLTTYELADHGAWSADDLHAARFHHLGLILDVDQRLDRQQQRRFWEAQVAARFLPDDVIAAFAGEEVRERLERLRREAPDYRPPRPPPGPVARP